MFEMFMALALVALVVNVVLSMIITARLQKRNVKINFFLIKLLIPKYVHQYRAITLEEQGTVGGLFYGWVTSINAALMLAVAGILVKVL
ncbi:MAG: hypothetical protein KAJ12_13355 [Bacteroidetes bacterium]|nr:hypothetical protein [Bacteroidota bacterium]